MQVKTLEKTAFDTIIECFVASFKNYFVEIPTDAAYYKARWEMAKVDLSLSFGMFDNEKLVGFIINAIDTRNGIKIAYNTGTGVLPEYRGQKIVKTIYQNAIPQLMVNGITKCLLEVIAQNEIAIKLYKSIGFDICKNYKSFKGQLTIQDNLSYGLTEIALDGIENNRLMNQEHYSWDFQIETVKYGSYRYYQVVSEKNAIGYFIINPVNGGIAQFDVYEDLQMHWQLLFNAIASISKSVKIVNVDEQQTNKIKTLESIGLDNFIDQYEMEMILTLT